MHRTFSVPCRIGWWSLLVALTLHVGTLAASAQSTIQPANYAPGQSDNPQRPVIRMVLGTSSTCTMTTRADLKRVENPNGKIVRVERIPDKTNEIRLVAEFPGRTFVTFTDQKDYVEIHEVVVVVGEVQDAKKITILKLEKGDQITKTLEKPALGGLRITKSEVVEVKQAQNDPKTFTFIARGAGTTRVFFFADKDQQNILAVFDVEVAPEDPIGQLRDIIKQIPTSSVTVTKIKLPPLAGVPQQPGVPITIDGVILTGYVTNAEDAATIVAAARRLFPASPTGQMQQVSSGATTTTTTLTRDNVINQIRIAGVQQVQLHVVVAVVNRTRVRNMSFSWAANGNEWFLGSLLGGPASFLNTIGTGVMNTAGGAAGGGGTGATITQATGTFNVPFGVIHNNNNFMSFLQILTTEGCTKILAEPRVTTLSGRPANILSGGSTPILTSAGVGAPSVSYQQFGTVVNCLPVVQGNGKILLDVKADISSINAANGISIAGVTPTSVPGFDQRTAQVTVMLEDGQTIAIGGLIQNKVNATISKIPVLGDLPWLSIFFTSKTYNENEEEMIILVTPRLVDPVDCTKIPKYLPGQETRGPDDFEFFLEGIMEAPRKPRSVVFHPHLYQPAYKNAPPPFGGITPCADGSCNGGGNGQGGCASGNCGSTNPPPSLAIPRSTPETNANNTPLPSTPTPVQATPTSNLPTELPAIREIPATPGPATPFFPTTTSRELQTRPVLPPVSPGPYGPN